MYSRKIVRGVVLGAAVVLGGCTSVSEPGGTPRDVTDFTYIQIAGLPITNSSASFSFPSDLTNNSLTARNFFTSSDFLLTRLTDTPDGALLTASFSGNGCTVRFSVPVQLTSAIISKDVTLTGAMSSDQQFGDVRCTSTSFPRDGGGTATGSTSAFLSGTFRVNLYIEEITSDTTGNVGVVVYGDGSVPFLFSSPSRGGNATTSMDFQVFGERRRDGSVWSGSVMIVPPSAPPTGGVSPGTCANTIQVPNMLGYYTAFNYSGGALGQVKTASAVRQTMEGGYALQLTTTPEQREGTPLFRLRLMIPTAKFGVGQVSVRDDQNILGFDSTGGGTGGAVVYLGYGIGSSGGTPVVDPLWSNKDWQSQQVRASSGTSFGLINITSKSATQIKGTYSGVTVTGDNYHPTNYPNYIASGISGTFCVNF